MRVDLQAADRTVALHADSAVGVAGLTGSKVLASLPGMFTRPLVLGQDTVGVAGLAHGRREE